MVRAATSVLRLISTLSHINWQDWKEKSSSGSDKKPSLKAKNLGVRLVNIISVLYYWGLYFAQMIFCLSGYRLKKGDEF